MINTNLKLYLPIIYCIELECSVDVKKRHLISIEINSTRRLIIDPKAVSKGSTEPTHRYQLAIRNMLYTI